MTREGQWASEQPPDCSVLRRREADPTGTSLLEWRGVMWGQGDQEYSMFV